MEEILRCGFQFKCGDLVTILPGLQHLYKTKGIKAAIYQRVDMMLHNETSDQITMSLESFEMIKPLIEKQEYVQSFEIWRDEKVDFDFIKSRDSRMIPLPASSIHHWAFFSFPQLNCDLSEDWLHLPPNGNIFNDLIISDHVIINRTERYLNPYTTYFFLKDYQDKIIFSGTEREHKAFCKQWELDIPRLVVKDFLELAQAIRYCKFFLGNQSFHFHLADAMHTSRILEVCPMYPNTLPTGRNGKSFVYQEALELYFKQLIA